jgi:hypothetical protein
VLLPPLYDLFVKESSQVDRPLYHDVAQTMELIILAVERGASDVYDTRPVKIINNAQLKQ